jgi:hypothetical protein
MMPIRRLVIKEANGLVGVLPLGVKFFPAINNRTVEDQPPTNELPDDEAGKAELSVTEIQNIFMQ